MNYLKKSFFFAFFAIVLISCAFGQRAENQNGKKDLLHFSNEKNTVFFDSNSRNFYILQTEKTQLKVPQKVSFLEYRKGLLVLKDETTKKIINYKLDGNIYGIIVTKGAKMEQQLLTSQGSFVDNIGGAYLLVDCSCVSWMSGSTSCDSGGSGSSSCSIGSPDGSSCSVSCGDSYSSCCNAE